MSFALRVFLCMVLFLSCFNSAAVQVIANNEDNKLIFSSLPKWVNTDMPQQYSRSEGPMDIQYLSFSSQVNLTSPIKQRFVRLHQKVLNQQGLTRAAEIDITFSPAYQQVKVHELYVIRDGKKLDRKTKSSIKLFQEESELDRGMYQELWQVLIILDDVRVNDEIHYSYTVAGSNPVLGDKHFGVESLEWNIPLQHFSFHLQAPAEVHLAYQLENIDLPVNDKVVDGVRYLSIERNNIAAVELEEGNPQWFNPYAIIEYSQYRDWQEVNDWALKLYPSDQVLPQELKQLLAEQNFSNKVEAATFVTQWIQDNIRYFGIETGVNSHKPSTPFETLERRYGDCKDKTVLLNSALRHLGLDAKPALVSTAYTRSLTDRLPSPGVFNHVITHFEWDDKTYWVDATMNGQKGSITSNSFPDLKWGFVIKPQSEKLTEMKPVTPAQVMGNVNIEETIKMDEKGEGATLYIKALYSGWQAQSMRGYISSVGLASATQDFVKFYSGYFNEMSAEKSIKVTELNNSQLMVESWYRLDGLSKPVASRNEVKLYASSIISQLQMPKARQRKSPYAVVGHLKIRHRINLIPHDDKDVLWWGNNNNVDLKTAWFDYGIAVEKAENQLVVDYFYHSHTESVAAAEFGNYLSQLDELDRSLAYSLWLKKQPLAEDERNKKRKEDVRNLLQSLMKQ